MEDLCLVLRLVGWDSRINNNYCYYYYSSLSFSAHFTNMYQRRIDNCSPIQDYVHPDDQTQPTFDIILLRI